jgi:hypothetical protein
MTDTAPLAAQLAAQKAELVAVPDGPVEEPMRPLYQPAVPAPVAPPKVLGGIPHLHTLMTLADAICRTEMVPQVMKNRPDAILAVMMAGAELGVGPMQSLQGIDLIQGRPSVSAELMRALVAQAGHTIILEVADDHATATCRRKEWSADQPSALYRWTLDDAKRAGLAGKDGWKKYPRAMLTARVTSEACRAVFPDVIVGLSYVPEELESLPAATQGLSKPGEVVLATVAPTEAQEQPEDPVAAALAAQLRNAERTADIAMANLEADEALAADMAHYDHPDDGRIHTEGQLELAHSVNLETGEVTVIEDQTVTPRQELGQALREIIDGHSAIHKPVLRGFLREKFGSAKDLSEEQLHEAVKIAAGWPTTASGDPRDDEEGF